MVDNCSHLDPREIGMEKLQPVLIWSRDAELLERHLPYIRDEFCEEILLLDINHLHFSKKLVKEGIENVLGDYDFHFIKVNEKTIELIFRDNTKIVADIYNLEHDLEQYVRKVIQWGREK
jgi:hypothetical protein